MESTGCYILIMNCNNCQKEFQKKRPHNAGRFCSLSCYYAWKKTRAVETARDGLTHSRRWYLKNKARAAQTSKNYAKKHEVALKEYRHQWYLRRGGRGGGRDKKRLPPRVNTTCSQCGAKLSLQPNQVKNRKNVFCSHVCYSRWWSKNRRAENSARWKGGRRLRLDGYVEVRLQPDDPFYSMQSVRHYVVEHRLVMAKHLGKCLLPWEVVHHINGIKDDNRIENLALLDGNGNHNTMLDKCCKRLQKENDALRTRVAELEAELTGKTPKLLP